MGTIVESATLNFTDLTGAKTGCTKLGSNKFWKGWVVDHGDGSGDFECKWGSTGEPGSDKGSQRGITLGEARKQLAKKVAEKEKKGYTKLDTRTDDDEVAKLKAKGLTPTTAATTAAPVVVASQSFHHEVSRLLSVIYNETSRVVRAGLSAQAGATEANPIGNLSDRQLDLGGSILDNIQAMLDKHFGGETPQNKTLCLPLQGNIPMPTVIQVTNEFMSNVPRAIGRENRGQENLHRLVISSYARLEEQRTFLQLLRDAHLSADTFKAAATATTATGKESVWYDGLGCAIEYCEPGTREFQRVVDVFNTNQSRNNSNWFQNGRCVLQVKRVFKLTRNGTEPRFDAYAAKVKAKPGAVGIIPGFHGTRVANILGISKSGLLMPENLPRGVQIAGKAFGAGIYHAPVMSNVKTIHGVKTDGTNGALKSANYMGMEGSYYGSGNTSRNGFMFLEDVALGKGEIRSSVCWNQHRPAGWPMNDFIYAAASTCSSLTHDEIVTFDQDAQVFRFLLELEVR